MRIRWSLAAVAIALLGVAAACGGPGESSAGLGETSQPDVAGSSSGEPGTSQLNAILATTVLRLGPQRVAFVLTRPDGLVVVPEATVTSVYVDRDGVGETKQAHFFLWPYGVRGSYVTELSFDRTGRWRLDITVLNADGTTGRAQLDLDVAREVSVRDIGELPPFADNPTVHDVERLSELTSASSPDPDLYLKTIPEALTTGDPTVVVFSTPAFCTSPTCGPQVDVLTELKDRYPNEASFIHVEVYANPEEIQGDLSLARYSPLVEAWGLSSVPGWTNESWTFVLGRDGRIASRFEAFTPLEELEQALKAALDG